MKAIIFRSIHFILLAFAVLTTGCATKFERQAFNNEAATHVKKITLTRWNEQEEMPTFLVNHPAAGFGLLGAAIVISDRSSKTKTMTEALNMTKTPVISRFYEKAISSLKSAGYEAIPVDVRRGDKAELVRESALKDQGQDATLLIGVDSMFIAAGPTSDYYPSLVMVAEMIDNKDKSVLYRESYHYGYNNGVKEVAHIAAANHCKFKNMEELTANIEITRNCMMDGIDILVKQLISDLKK